MNPARNATAVPRQRLWRQRCVSNARSSFDGPTHRALRRDADGVEERRRLIPSDAPLDRLDDFDTLSLGTRVEARRQRSYCNVRVNLSQRYRGCRARPQR